MIHQGEIYWVDLELPAGSEPGLLRPCVVVQNDLANSSRLTTTMLCGVTSRIERARHLGNVLLESGEGGLPRRSVVNVSQVVTVDKSQLHDRIGALSAKRVREIIHGINLFLEPREPIEG